VGVLLGGAAVIAPPKEPRAMPWPNHARLGTDCVHVRLTRDELEYLCALLTPDPYVNDDDLALDGERDVWGPALHARLADLLRGLG
jgi:hypothetical protein